MKDSGAGRIQIGFIINDLLLGGTQSILLNIVSRLDPDRFGKAIYCLRDYAATGDSRVEISSQFAAAGARLVPLSSQRVGRLTLLLRLYRQLRRDRPEVVHCCLPDAVIIGTIAARLAGVRNVVIHEQNTHRFYTRKLRVAFEFARRLARLSIFYSNTLEAELMGDSRVLLEPVSRLERRSYTVRNGIDLERVDETSARVDRAQKRSELGVAADDLLVFTASRLIPWKANDYLIRSFAEVCGQFPSAKLLIAGEGADEAMLRSLIDELGVSAQVRLIGPRTDVFEILAVSDVYPQAYAYPEGFSSISIGMSGMEAMAFRLPLVISRYPDIYEHIADGENVLIVEPRDVPGQAAALARLLSSPEDRARIGASARAFVERYFSHGRSIAIYESLYRIMAEGNHP